MSDAEFAVFGPEDNVTPTEVPVPTPGGGNPPPDTPEPATLALAGAGLAALAGQRLARGRAGRRGPV